MDHEKARDFIKNLVERLEEDGGKYRLHGGLLTKTEVDALRLLAGHEAEGQTPNQSDLVADASANVELNFGCLDAQCSEDWVVCIDFGTAFSKAALWDQRPALKNEDAPGPIPLRIGQGLSSDPLLIDSVVFVGDERVHFGPDAIVQFERSADPRRQLFDSPKEVLTLDFSTLQFEKPGPECDPSGSFKKKDLLILYLGFLTALTNRALADSDQLTLAKRRFATPGWNDAQPDDIGGEYTEIVEQMRRFLAEAQILADSFPVDSWIEGLPIEKVRKAIDQLAVVEDDKLLSASFVDRPVLEAAAAASSVKERLLNKRPQVMIVDVGAGTTDIGVFKYVGSDEDPKFAAYTNGFAALKMAGKRLDDAFKALVKRKLELDQTSTALASLNRVLAKNIHEYKRKLFEDGAVTVRVDGLPDAVIYLDEFLSTQKVLHFKNEFEKKIIDVLRNADGADGASFLGSTENVVVFTGGGGKLPFLRDAFLGGVEIGSSKAYFEVIDPRPSWLDEAEDEVKVVFPQISVSVGGASPDLPRQLPRIRDTAIAGPRTIAPIYKS